MKITHVIRGEEWLSSTAHHVLLYKAFGWEKERPVFSHLPLILKPTGKGKLSKRDGAKFDMPVFPIEWNEEGSLNSSKGFKEFGFLPEAVLNFLALLGWNPGNDKELMTIQELIEIFTLDKVSKSGARFDFEKAKWFNQQYLLRLSEEELYPYVKRIFLDNGNSIEEDRLYKLINLFKDRVITLHDFYNQSLFLFQPLSQYDETAWRKKVDESLVSHLHLIGKMMDSIQDYSKKTLEETLKSYLIENNLSPGKIFPLLRIAVSGFLQGPDLMATLEFLGPKESTKRIERALELL
jgi:glutamyl-tRNA synthetase